MPNKLELKGKKFGRLTVISEAGRNKFHEVEWVCKCKCGTVFVTSGRNLNRGDTNSCGCLLREYYDKDVRKHGHIKNGSKTTEYRIWGAMKSRCYNTKNKYYYNYGGRGITVCRRWVNSFSNFLEDMGPRPSKDHSIDRIKNNRGYSPKNCRWATKHQQERNRRSNIWLVYNGERKILKDWADQFGVGYNTMKGLLGSNRTFAQVVEHYKKKKNDKCASLCANRA